MASIQQRIAKDGTASFRVQVRVLGFPPQTATFERKTDAKRWAQQTEAAMREGRFFTTSEARRHTLTELIDRYVERLTRDQAASLAKQKQILGWWRATLGAYALAHVTPALISKQRDKLLSENIGTEADPAYRSGSTANRYLAALSAVFTVAVKEWHLAQENPVLRVQKGRENPGRVRYLSEGELQSLLAACTTSRLKQLELIVLLAVSTGMRRGEIQALRWNDVDLQRRLIVLQKTKNGERRSVPIAAATAAKLKEHAKVRPIGTDLVFPHPAEDRPLNFDHGFIDAVKAAGIKDFRFHDLRHTAASYMAMSGATTAEIAAVLGHRTLAMVKRYAHLSDQHTAAVLERMNTKFLGG